MSWIDFLIIFILLYSALRSLKLGFIRSIFGIVQFILVIFLTKTYYPYFYGYIMSNSVLYSILSKFFEIIINILFFRKVKENPNFLTDIMSKGLFEIFTKVLCLIIFYFIIKLLLTLVFNLLSFIFKAPILKQLDKIAGIIFGFVKGMFIIYLLFIFFIPISSIYPEGIIGKGIDNSLFSVYFQNSNLLLELFSIKHNII